MAIATPSETLSPGEMEATRRVAWWKPPLTAMALVIAGLCIGWLVGLSVSPVVSIIITSVTASAAAVVAAMSGVDGESRVAGLHASPVPLALLLLGMALGSTAGVMARSQNWLGPDLSSEVKQWTDLGVEKKVVVDTLFTLHVAETSSSAVQTASPDQFAGLNSVTDRGFCDMLAKYSDRELLASMQNAGSTPSVLTTIARHIDDPAVFRKVFKDLCDSTYF